MDASAGRLHLKHDDRIALCHEVDFPRFLEVELGVSLVREGSMLTCLSPLREERTPSCRIYPPGVGKQGARGWTFCDFGGADNESGDALGLAIGALQLSFSHAAYRLAQYTPDPSAWGSEASQRRPVAPRVAVEIPVIPPALQRLGVAAMLSAVAAEVPDSITRGCDYLRARGASDQAINLLGPAYHIPNAEASRAITTRLLADSNAVNAAWHAGLVYFLPNSDRKECRLMWETDGGVVLMPCLSRDGVTPFYMTGRRLDWQPHDEAPKYRGQSMRHGAQRAPYGLPSLMQAAHENAPMIICEGATDVQGAVTLGMHAIAMLCRPNAYGIEDSTSPAARQLTWLLADLRACSEIIVLPDNDDTADKTLAGINCATRLVEWLCYRGGNARIGAMSDFGFGQFKDLSEAAHALSSLDSE